MFAALGFAIKYLPLIVAAVSFVQNFADKDAPGSARKDLAVGFVKDVLRKFDVTVNARTEVVIGFLVDLAVTALNKFGIFESSEGADPVALKVASAVALETRVPAANDARLEELEAALLTR